MDQLKLNPKTEQQTTSQEVANAILFGTLGAFAAAIAWGAITYWTGYYYVIAAVFVGIIVGYSVKYGAKGTDPIMGYLGGGLAILGCLMGNYFCEVAYSANLMNVGFWDLLAEIGISGIFPVIQEFFMPIDLPFYAAAGYMAYKVSTLNEKESTLNR